MLEIERKFLVVSDEWRSGCLRRSNISQGYIFNDGAVTARVRRLDDKAFVCFKSGLNPLQRQEWEFEIALVKGLAMLEQLCAAPIIVKTRHYHQFGGLLWEIDEFAAPIAGLVVAEVELAAADQNFEKPHWLGREVTLEPAYTNAQMCELARILSGDELAKLFSLQPVPPESTS